MTSATTAGARAIEQARVSPWERAKLVLSYGLLILLALAFFYPFVYAIFSSFKPLPEIAANPTALFPKTWTLDAYRQLSRFDVPRWAFNSAFIAVTITLTTVAFASMGGYALARIRFPGHRAVFLSILGTMMVPGIVLLIPMFIILKMFGWVDTYAGLIFPKMVTAFGVFLMKQFFESTPVEIEEAARIDGASRFEMFYRVVLPLARPALVALVIFTFQGSWNDFMHPLIVVTVNQDIYTLPLGLALLRGNMGQNLQWNVLMAASMLTTLPMALIFFFFQRYFVEGVSYSGIKG